MHRFCDLLGILAPHLVDNLRSRYVPRNSGIFETPKSVVAVRFYMM